MGKKNKEKKQKKNKKKQAEVEFSKELSRDFSTQERDINLKQRNEMLNKESTRDSTGKEEEKKKRRPIDEC